jgi:hypothetical protein
LLGQKKETKEKAAPHTALILRFSHLSRVFRKGIPALAKNARHPCRAPAGKFSPNAAMLGAV